MVDDAGLHQTIADFVQIMAGTYEIDGVLPELVDAAVRVLGCQGCGVVLRDEHGLRVVTATGDAAARVQSREVADGHGPCHDALRTGQTITSHHLDEETRWPGLRSRRPDAVSALAAVPLLAYGRTVGALLLCWEDPHRVTPDELRAAWLLAGMAAAHVVNVEVATDDERLRERLREVAAAEAGRGAADGARDGPTSSPEGPSPPLD